MEPVYRELVRQFGQLTPGQRQRLRQQWLSFNLDEYVGTGPADPGSFAATMERQLVGPLGLDPARVRLPDGLAADPQAEALRFAAELGRAGGIGLQLLGLGLNGHVGFNEPPCGAESSCRVVTLCSTTRAANAAAFGGDPLAVPGQAITLGLREILQAERILLVVTGAAKAPVLRRVLQEPSTADLPAGWLRVHPEVQVVADGAALGRAV